MALPDVAANYDRYTDRHFRGDGSLRDGESMTTSNQGGMGPGEGYTVTRAGLDGTGPLLYVHGHHWIHLSDHDYPVLADLPASNAVIDTNSSTVTPLNDLLLQVATMTYGPLDVPKPLRRWVGGADGLWACNLGVFLNEKAPYVRWTQVGDHGTVGIGRWVLSYP